MLFFQSQCSKGVEIIVVQWADYLLCSDLPNTDSAADMNSFLTIWRDSLSEDEHRNLAEDFAECTRGLKVS